jgi:primosomal protein N' (replication factor Y)
MNIVEVIPITKSVRIDTLTYYTTKKISIGNLVTVPIRKKYVTALVIGVKDGKEMKESLRSSDFALKKVKSVLKKKLFKKEFIRMVSEISEYYATNAGLVLNQLTSTKIIESSDKIKVVDQIKKDDKKTESLIYVVQADRDDRYSQYKNYIRERLAQKESVIFIVPTQSDIDFADKYITRGIKNRVFTLSPNLSITKLISTWNNALESEKPVVVITTQLMLHIPRNDIGAIIIDKESSPVYKAMRRPYTDGRKVARIYAKHLGVRLIIGDTLLTIETLNKVNDQTYMELSPLVFRSLTPATTELVDMTEEKDSPTISISNNLLEMLLAAKEENANSFIFTARKGLFSSVVCDDCKHVRTCNFCSSPLVLHGGSDPTNKNFLFRCHSCGEEQQAGGLCPDCKSWKLTTLGIGIQQVERDINELLPESKTFVLSKDTASTTKKAKDIVEKYYKTPGAILIGTEMSIPYLNEEIEYVGVSSLDTLLSLPDFRIRERLMHILLALRKIAFKKIIVQTRHPDEIIFEYGLSGNLVSFYREEEKVREKYGYPPFMTLIKVTRADKKEVVEEEMSQLVKFFSPHELHVYPAFTEKVKNAYVMHGLIRLDPSKWPEKELADKLRMLPPNYRVEIDAQSLL